MSRRVSLTPVRRATLTPVAKPAETLSLEMQGCMMRCKEEEKRRSEKDKKRIEQFDKWASKWENYEEKVKKAKRAGKKSKGPVALPKPTAEEAKAHRMLRMAKYRKARAGRKFSLRGSGRSTTSRSSSRSTSGSATRQRSAWPKKLATKHTYGSRSYTVYQNKNGKKFFFVKGAKHVV